MKVKIFETYTFAIVKTVKAIEMEFNIWANENKNIDIIRTDYFINERKNKSGMKYEELTLLVFYKTNLNL